MPRNLKIEFLPQQGSEPGQPNTEADFKPMRYHASPLENFMIEKNLSPFTKQNKLRETDRVGILVSVEYIVNQASLFFTIDR